MYFANCNIIYLFTAMSNQQLVELQRNKESARKFVFSHIAKGVYFTYEIGNNQVICETLSFSLFVNRQF